jgi:ABC-type multidrug transport system permease subunit
MILAGNGEPVNLSHNNYMVPWLTGIISITAILLLFFIFLRKRRFRWFFALLKTEIQPFFLKEFFLTK